MHGGVSQVDTFDYRPALQRDNGKAYPGKKPRIVSSATGDLVASPYSFKHYGQCGQWASEIFPNIASMSDELCFIKSMYGSNSRHLPAQLLPQASRMGPTISARSLPRVLVLLSQYGPEPYGRRAISSMCSWCRGSMPSRSPFTISCCWGIASSGAASHRLRARIARFFLRSERARRRISHGCRRCC